MASRVWLYCSGSVVQKSQTQNGNPTKHNKVAIVIIRNPKRLSPNLNPSRVTIKRTHNRRTWQAGSTQPRMKRSWPCVIGLSLPGQKKIGQLMLEVCGLRILFIIRLQDFRRKSPLDPAQIRPQLSASGCISPENLLDVDL